MELNVDSILNLFFVAVELDAGGEAVVDSGVDSEVSPSSPDEADDAAATAADGGAEANAGNSRLILLGKKSNIGAATYQNGKVAIT